MQRAAAAVVLALAASATAAPMYKCVDERGVTHYADKPTPGCANAPVDIRASPPISGALAPSGEDAAQQEADFRRRRMEREEAERLQRAERAELLSRCTSLKQERAVLSSGRRLVQINEQGERVYLDDAVRAQRLAEVQAALEQCP
ncbi:MAG TPA: DUF4124 domain-containing protein [Burkholderiales bacterium]|nr:DUF4124 domain-containing protein [Burkholderiales bacterium]